MSRYLFDEDGIHDYINALKKIDEDMKASYVKAFNLKERIENCDWKGRANDAMVAFMDLTVVKFHSTFNTNSPIEEAIKEYESFEDVLSDFYRNFPTYLAMNKI